MSKLRVVGRVKWFNPYRGYGFIETENIQDIYVHYTAIVAQGFRLLEPGDIVEFLLEDRERGPAAVEVKCIKKAFILDEVEAE